MAPRKRKKRGEPPPPRTNAVAWIALVLSLVALGLALSEKPWVKSRFQTVARNWGTVVGEIESAVGRDSGLSAEEPLDLAAEAARGGEDAAMNQRLDEAIDAVRLRAEELGGDISRRLRQVARDLERLRGAGEANGQTASSIDELRSRFTELDGEADDSTAERPPPPSE